MGENKGRRPELLAPVGEWDSLVAAVQNGADAVYLGGKEFSARQSAANFGPDELSRAVNYAHVRGTRVYVTVNTLIKESEIEPVLWHIDGLCEAGVDAVIVQDIGLMTLIRRIFPFLPVHASTQATVHHPDGVRWLADLGVERVVVARELGLPEIEECARVGSEIEVFVHGALCVCYSGQCLMSSMIGGRSGNRGRCAQPCRLEYSLVDAGGRLLDSGKEAGPHLLSTRELAGLDLLPELAWAGVSALKVEGRMKRPEYVATVVRVYREALDRLAAGEELSTERDGWWQELAQAFNRGFTPGYLLGNPGRELMSYQRPSNRGVFLGRVSYYDRRRGVAVLRLESGVSVGDGVEVWVSKGGRAATTLSRFWPADRRDGAARPLEHAGPGEKIVIPIRGAIAAGDRVFKTSDARLKSRAAATFSSDREQLGIPLWATLTLRLGEPGRLVLTDREGRQGIAQGTVPASRAEKRPLDHATLQSQLDRLGNTPFRLEGVELDADPGLMLPWSELNALRRSALERLNEARESPRPAAGELSAARQVLVETVRRRRGCPPIREPGASARPALAVAISDPGALPAVLKAGPDRVILGGERFRPARSPFLTGEEVAEAARRCRDAGVELVLGFPRIIRRREMELAVELARTAAELPERERPTALLIGNLGLLRRLTSPEAGGGTDRTALPLHADWPLNLFNAEAVALLAGQGVVQAALSPELTLSEVAEVAGRLPVPVEILVHGPLELMVTEYCAPGALLGGRTSEQACSRPCFAEEGWGLLDRLGLVFPVKLDASCRMHVANAKELCLIEHLEALADAGAGTLRLDCRLREERYAVQVTSAYRTALGALGRPDASEAAAALRRELEALSPSGVTKGHYFRGVE